DGAEGNHQFLHLPDVWLAIQRLFDLDRDVLDVVRAPGDHALRQLVHFITQTFAEITVQVVRVQQKLEQAVAGFQLSIRFREPAEVSALNFRQGVLHTVVPSAVERYGRKWNQHALVHDGIEQSTY